MKKPFQHRPSAWYRNDSSACPCVIGVISLHQSRASLFGKKFSLRLPGSAFENVARLLRDRVTRSINFQKKMMTCSFRLDAL
jgi:hypothetical protein